MGHNTITSVLVTQLCVLGQREDYGQDQESWYLLRFYRCSKCGLLGEGTIDGQASEWVEVEWVPLLFSHFPYFFPRPFSGQERTADGLALDWVKLGSSVGTPFSHLFWAKRGRSAGCWGRGRFDGQASEWVKLSGFPYCFPPFPTLFPTPFMFRRGLLMGWPWTG